MWFGDGPFACDCLRSVRWRPYLAASKIYLCSASLVCPHRLDIGRDGLGYIVLFFSSFCYEIQFRGPYIRIRRQAPVIILQQSEGAFHQCTVFTSVRNKHQGNGWNSGHTSKVYFPNKARFYALSYSCPPLHSLVDSGGLLRGIWNSILTLWRRNFTFKF